MLEDKSLKIQNKLKEMFEDIQAIESDNNVVVKKNGQRLLIFKQPGSHMYNGKKPNKKRNISLTSEGIDMLFERLNRNNCNGVMLISDEPYFREVNFLSEIPLEILQNEMVISNYNSGKYIVDNNVYHKYLKPKTLFTF